MLNGKLAYRLKPFASQHNEMPYKTRRTHKAGPAWLQTPAPTNLNIKRERSLVDWNFEKLNVLRMSQTNLKKNRACDLNRVRESWSI